jgi:tRNA threonylcarbamoyladenosine biosynthesis protein TsaE
MASPLELHTAGPEETRSVGEAIAELLRPGDVVSLTGDLGAGKTTFVQGVAKGLGVAEPVLSPTFTLVREYDALGLHVYHVDIYRLERVQEVLDLGFDEMVDQNGVVLVEWGDALGTMLPESHLRVELTMDEAAADQDGSPREGRRLSISGHGKPWALRSERLAELTRPWRAAEPAA